MIIVNKKPKKMRYRPNYFMFIGLLLFIFILYKLDFKEILKTFQEINLLYIAIAIFFLPIMVFLRGLKWHLIIKSMKLHFPLHSSCYGYLIGSSFGALTPGRVGNFFRVKILKDATKTSTTKALSSLIFDNFFDVLTLTIFSIVSLSAFFIVFKRTVSPLYILLLLAICLFIYLLARIKILMKLKPFLKKLLDLFLPSNLKNRAKIGIRKVLKTMSNANTKFLVLAFITDIASFLVAVVCSYFIGFSLGIKVSFLAILMFLSISSFVAMLPISISGLGTREATLIFLMGFVNVSAEKAVSFSLLTTILTNWLFAIAGSFFLLRYKKLFQENNLQKNKLQDKPLNKLQK